MDVNPDPLARLASALETLSASQIALADAAERLARAAGDDLPRQRLTGAAATSRKAARHAAAAAARVSDAASPALEA
jgi:hypothetical protein